MLPVKQVSLGTVAFLIKSISQVQHFVVDINAQDCDEMALENVTSLPQGFST